MAPEYLSPGVYVEEVDRGSKPIEGVGTSTAGFVGSSRKGPRGRPLLVTSWGGYLRAFGDSTDGLHLASAAYGFFLNGGTRLFVVNVAPEGTGGAGGGDPERKATGKKPADRGSAAGADGAPPAPTEAARIIGEDAGPGRRTGLRALEELDEIAIVCAPGQTDPAVQDALLSHCESRRYRFAILDGPEEIPEGGVERSLEGRPRDSSHGAVYFPWIEVFDPPAGRRRFIPPSGHLAGIYARTDGARGVHKAPANEVVRGALGLRYPIARAEQDLLNPRGLNCIRALGDRGIRVWGGRTLSSDPAWRYINIRRLFIFVERSIEEGTQWVVFEPNDEALWKRIARDVTAFLLRVWKTGALAGTTAERAFYVKCDAETNPRESVEAGRVVIEVGLAPTRPAEFVIFRISQWSDDESPS